MNNLHILIKKSMKNQKQGFTLIELLVVIAIIGLLATLSVVALNNARERARDSRRVSDIKQIQTALELYYNANNYYPKLTDWSTMAQLGAVSEMDGFIDPIPDSPLPADGDCTYGGNDPNQAHEEDGDKYGTLYSYQGVADGSTYQLVYCLGDGDQKTATPFTISSE